MDGYGLALFSIVSKCFQDQTVKFLCYIVFCVGSFGHVTRFFHALSFGAWTSSSLFSVPELWSNTLSAYYILLFSTMIAYERMGTSLWNIFLPRATSRNLCRLLGQLAVRLWGWPAGEEYTFEPSQTTEDSIEFTFGEIKSSQKGVHGTASTSNAIAATQLLHARRAQCEVQARRVGYGRLLLQHIPAHSPSVASEPALSRHQILMKYKELISEKW